MNGLRYISWADNTGYATAAKAYIRALMGRNIPLTWTPMLPGRSLYEPQVTTQWPDAQLGTVCNKKIPYDTVLIHTVPEYFPEFVAEARAGGQRVIGYTVWELDELPPHWPAILNTLDALIVPTEWNAAIFRKSGVNLPIHVVPHLSQFGDEQHPSDRERAALLARLNGHLRPETFLVYAIGQWSHRKAPYLALEAYWNAFSREDDVLMVIKTNASDFTQSKRDWRSVFRRRHPDPARVVERHARLCANTARVIVISDETLSDGELLALHERGDCFISLARAEGWGLGTFDAARLGKPVVTTGYGGQMAYVDREHSYVVDYKRVPVNEPAWSSYDSTLEWAEPDIAQAARHLRSVHSDRGNALARSRHQAERIRQNFSADSAVDALLRALS